MASLITSSAKLLLLLTFFNAVPTYSFTFHVGGDNGWTDPPHNNSHIFNEWASHNRFQVGDIISFNYTKDSVMVVNKEEYDKCKTSRPLFFSNSGHTEYKLEHSGRYYFISGVAGHCQRGQKMIIKVLSYSEAHDGAPVSGNHTETPPHSHVSGAVVVHLPALPQVFALGFSYLGFQLFHH